MGDDGLLGVLSADLWRIILQALPLPSLCELRCVNTAFHELCAPVLLHRLHLASSSSALFLYFPSSAPTHEIAVNTDFLLVLHGHSRKCLPLPLPSHLPRGFYLRASGGGLLLFCDSRKQVRSPRLLVYNPILGCWKLLPRPPPKVPAHVLDISVIHGTLYYNVVVVNNTGWVAVYHSETEDWDTVKLSHSKMSIKGVYNGALYWATELYWNDSILKVTTLSTRTYETSSEELIDFDTFDIFGVARGDDGAAVLNVHVNGEWVGTATKGQETDRTWMSMECGKIDDYCTGSRIAYAGGVLCNIPWEVDSIPWMIDLKSHTHSDIDQISSVKPFCNVPCLNDVLPFHPSMTPVAHDIANTRMKEKGVSTARCSNVIKSIPFHHKSSINRAV